MDTRTLGLAALARKSPEMIETNNTSGTPPLEVNLRRASVADAENIARVNLDTWRVAYRNLLPTAYLDAMSLEKSVAAQK